MIDVLSKYAVAVPIKSKTLPDVVAGTMERLQKMKAQPKTIYTDDERGIASAEFKEYVDCEGIELYRTRNHPAFAERFIRTSKDMTARGHRTTQCLLSIYMLTSKQPSI